MIKIQKGDTVIWSGDAMHNSASINNMLPKGSSPWEGKLTKEAGEVSISVKFETEGVYGYKCTPHEMFGMVGLVVVGIQVQTLVRLLPKEKKLRVSLRQVRVDFQHTFSNKIT